MLANITYVLIIVWTVCFPSSHHLPHRPSPLSGYTETLGAQLQDHCSRAGQAVGLLQGRLRSNTKPLGKGKAPELLREPLVQALLPTTQNLFRDFVFIKFCPGPGQEYDRSQG